MVFWGMTRWSSWAGESSSSTGFLSLTSAMWNTMQKHRGSPLRCMRMEDFTDESKELAQQLFSILGSYLRGPAGQLVRGHSSSRNGFSNFICLEHVLVQWHLVRRSFNIHPLATASPWLNPYFSMISFLSIWGGVRFKDTRWLGGFKDPQVCGRSTKEAFAVDHGWIHNLQCGQRSPDPLRQE